MRKNKKTLAAQLGITQQLLSRFLGIARTSITMFESSDRGIPYEGSFKYSLLSIALNSDQKPASLEGYEAKETAKVQQMLEKVSKRMKANCSFYKLSSGNAVRIIQGKRMDCGQQA